MLRTRAAGAWALTHATAAWLVCACSGSSGGGTSGSTTWSSTSAASSASFDATTSEDTDDSTGEPAGLTFELGPRLRAGAAPSGVAVGDFDGDGVIDVAAANVGGSHLSVWWNLGDGEFADEQREVAGLSPRGLVTADFDGDGRGDLAAANLTTNYVSVHLLGEERVFAAQHVEPTGKKPRALAAGDFNDDGRVDLVVVNEEDDFITALSGQGDGTFERLDVPGEGTGRAYDVALVDLDGDGLDDAIVAFDQADELAVFYGGAEGLEAGPKVEVAAGPRSVTAADISGDGVVDLVATSFGNSFLSIAPGQGERRFGEFAPFPVRIRPFAVSAADLNGDDAPDLVTSHEGQATLGVILSDGAGAHTGEQPFEAGGPVLETDVADLDGDGDLDIVVSSPAGSAVQVLWQE